MNFNIITIFPEAFESYFNSSILKRAQKRGLIKINFFNPRDFTKDKHLTVDDKPYGGGAGMVMKAEPILKAYGKIKKKGARKVVLLSAKGRQFNQKIARDWTKKYKQLIFISARYEGIDERVKIALKAEEISIGPYVLTDGDVATMVLISAITRLLPGAIKWESLKEESHFNLLVKKEGVGGKGLEYPHYTRPEILKYKGKKYAVPAVLLSGNHKKIQEWRRKNQN